MTDALPTDGASKNHNIWTPMHLNTDINTVYCQNVLPCSALSSWLFIEIFYCLILKSWYHLIQGESISGQNSLWRWEFHYLCWGTRAWSNTDTAALQTAPSEKQKWKGEKRLRHWINKFNQQTWSEEKRFSVCFFVLVPQAVLLPGCFPLPGEETTA